MRPPCASASATASRKLSTAVASINGPISVAGSSGSPMLTCAYASFNRAVTSVDARPMHDQPARRGAPLPGRADGAEQHRRHDEIEVGVGGDDHGVVARAFEQAFAEAAGDRRRDLAADRGRAGKRYQRDARIRGQRARPFGVADRQAGRSTAARVRSRHDWRGAARRALRAASSAMASRPSHCRRRRRASRSTPTRPRGN